MAVNAHVPDDVFCNMDTLMKRQGKLEKDLISYLGLSVGTYSQWRIGHGQSYLRYIKEICEYLHITPNELVLGEKAFEKNNINELCTLEEKKIIELYRSINNKEKIYIKGILQMMYEQQ